MVRVNQNKYKKLTINGVLLILMTACASPYSVSLHPEVMTKNAPDALEMRFEKGQMLSLISLAPKPGTAAALGCREGDLHRAKNPSILKGSILTPKSSS